VVAHLKVEDAPHRPAQTSAVLVVFARSVWSLQLTVVGIEREVGEQMNGELELVFGRSGNRWSVGLVDLVCVRDDLTDRFQLLEGGNAERGPE
jgi:hypothetical protein